MMALAKYDAACRALAAARRVDEVKRIRDTHLAMKASAKIAKNYHLARDAEAIIHRAERRLGELMAAQAKTVGKAKGGGEKGIGRRGNAGSDKTRITPPTLAEAGIDKNLAQRARTMASIDDASFEKVIEARHAPNGGSLMKQLTTLADALVDRELGEAPKRNSTPKPKPSPFYDPWSRLSRAVRDIADQDQGQLTALAQQSRRGGFLEMDIEHALRAIDRLSQWHVALLWEATHAETQQRGDPESFGESAGQAPH